MHVTNFQKSIVQNLRGFYLTQIISFLGKSKYLERVLNSKSIDIKKNNFGFSQLKLIIIFNYFSSIGFAEKKKNKFYLTDLGRDVLKRSTSFFVPHSYKNYFYHLDELVKNKYKNINVDRYENILGSGKTHLRYFLHAISLIKNFKSITSLIDIGVGNADFAINLNKQHKLNKVFGVDFSKVSVAESEKSLNKKKIKNKVIQIDGSRVDIWAKKAKKFLKNEKIVISLWFLIHEISNNSEKKITNFLKKIKLYFPTSPIVICELVKIPEKVLSENREITYIPEYLLFHELSNQNVLRIDQLERIIKNSSYKIDSKICFDELKDGKKLYPSVVLYMLK